MTTCDVSHLPTYKNSLVLCATAIVVARAFLTSESSEAHFLLFSRIFEIAQRDTGLEVTFHYINESGIQSIVADGHRGQALGRLKKFKIQNTNLIFSGLGLFCVSLCRENKMTCRYEPRHRLCDLGPYDHLR
jgi:hypothetical protein